MSKHTENTQYRNGHTLICSNHEYVCLSYEQALKAGYDAEYGPDVESGEYYVLVYACSLKTFAAILDAAEKQSQNHARQLILWDTKAVAA